MGKVCPKDQNCLFQVKFCTNITSIVLDSAVIFTFLFWTDNTLLEQICSKNSKLLFWMLFGVQNNSNVLNSMLMFICLVFKKDIFFGEIWSKISKLSFWDEAWCLGWKLVPRLIQIHLIWWWCSFILFWAWNYLFR